MNRIVRENYPVADLPEDLRAALPGHEYIRIVLEPAADDNAPTSPFGGPGGDTVLSLKELFALRKPPYRSTEDIVAEIRRERDEWHD